MILTFNLMRFNYLYVDLRNTNIALYDLATVVLAKKFCCMDPWVTILFSFM